MSIFHQLLPVGGLVCLVETLHMLVVLEQKSNIGLFGSVKHISQYYCLTYCSENASEVLYSVSYILYCVCAFFLHRYTATITVSSMTVLRTAPMIIPATHGKGELFASSHCALVIADVGLLINDVGLIITVAWVLKLAALLIELNSCIPSESLATLHDGTTRTNDIICIDSVYFSIIVNKLQHYVILHILPVITESHTSSLLPSSEYMDTQQL